MTKWNNKNSRDLFQTILRLNNLKEAKNFFRDLMTAEEIVELSRRWQAAQMLNAGFPYTEIQEKTGLSSTTVARISKWLNHGMKGYKTMLNKVHHPSARGKG